MSPVFTDYVRSLTIHGEPPDETHFNRLLDALRRALVYELKRRSLWNAPPSYLGITGGHRWSDGQLLEELLYDCYAFIFVHRLAGLVRQARTRRSIDGLVFLNIRHFLHDAQKRHDPVGSRLFGILHDALFLLVEEGLLHVLDGDPRIRTGTILGPSPAVIPFPRQASAAEGPADSPWSERVVAWCDDLLPGLMMTWKRQEAVAPLAVKLREVAEAGVAPFAFSDVLSPLIEEVRSRWRSAALVEQGEVAAETGDEEGEITLVPLVRPSNDFEERQAFAQLIECVEEGIERRSEKPRTRDYLRRLWLYLHQWAASAEEEELPNGDQAGSTAGRLPSDRKLAELLSIPRERFPELRAKLGELIERCRDGAAGGTLLPQSPVAQEGGQAMDERDRRQRLLQMTTEAAARVAAAHGLDESPSTAPQVGDVYVIPGLSIGVTGEDLPVEWVVLDRDSGIGRCRVVAADDRPWRGPRDVLARDDDGARLRLRCGVTSWVASGTLDEGARVGSLPASVVEEARQRAAEPPVEAGAEELEDPAAAEWQVRLLAAAGILATRSAPEALKTIVEAVDEPGDLEELEAVEYDQRPRRSREAHFRWLGMAASLLLAVSLVSLVVSWMRIGDLRHGVSVAERENARLGEELERSRTQLDEEVERYRMQLNPPWAEMIPHEPVRGEDAPVLPIRPDSLTAVLSFDVLAADHPRYRLRFVEVASGQEFYVSAEFTPSPTGSLRFLLDAATFERPGRVRVHLDGVTANGDVVPLEDIYLFDVEFEAGSPQ